MLDQRGGTFRASEQPPEPLGRRAVETALAKRSARERAGKIGIERGDRLGRKRIGNDAPSFAQEVRGPVCRGIIGGDVHDRSPGRSEEHTSELQSLMRISYAVFCLKKKKTQHIQTTTSTCDYKSYKQNY